VADTSRLDAVRFYAAVIDLCQEPGLAQRARTCLTRANDVDTARACPSLPATGDTVERVSSCDAVVRHALKVLVRESEVTVSPTDYVEEEQLFLRDCASASPEGRRCAVRARTIDAIGECLALRASSDGRDDSSDAPD
jgi:hypothetical protein